MKIAPKKQILGANSPLFQQAVGFMIFQVWPKATSQSSQCKNSQNANLSVLSLSYYVFCITDENFSNALSFYGCCLYDIMIYDKYCRHKATTTDSTFTNQYPIDHNSGPLREHTLYQGSSPNIESAYLPYINLYVSFFRGIDTKPFGQSFVYFFGGPLQTDCLSL